MTARRLAARWTRLAGLPGAAPAARSSHGLSAIGGRAYLFGGEAVARHAIDSTVHELDVEGGWKALVAGAGYEPVPRVGHAQCAVGGKLLVFGGRTGVDMGDGILNDTWLFDPGTQAWEELKDVAGTPPCARSYHRATAVGNKVFVFGGCGAEGRLADLHVLDLQARRWSALPSAPDIPGRGGPVFEASPDGHSLWMVGGFIGGQTNDVMRFDLLTESWTRAPSDWLQPRSMCASFALGLGHSSGPALFIFGGEVVASNKGHDGAGGFERDTVALEIGGDSVSSTARRQADGAPLQIEATGEIPPARGWTAAAALSPTEGLLFGGLAGSDAAPERLGDAWLLKVEDP